MYGIPNNVNEDQFLTRGDYIRSARHSLFGRYYFTDYRNPAEYGGNLLLTTRPGVLDRVQSLTVGDTFSLTNSAINAFHFTWSRDRVTRGPPADYRLRATSGSMWRRRQAIFRSSWWAPTSARSAVPARWLISTAQRSSSPTISAWCADATSSHSE